MKRKSSFCSIVLGLSLGITAPACIDDTTAVRQSESSIDIGTSQRNVAPWQGDVNGDRKVDFGDFLVLSNNYNRRATSGYLDADFDLNNRVDFTDFLLQSEAFETADPCNPSPADMSDGVCFEGQHFDSPEEIACMEARGLSCAASAEQQFNEPSLRTNGRFGRSITTVEVGGTTFVATSAVGGSYLDAEFNAVDSEGIVHVMSSSRASVEDQDSPWTHAQLEGDVGTNNFGREISMTEVNGTPYLAVAADEAIYVYAYQDGRWVRDATLALAVSVGDASAAQEFNAMTIADIGGVPTVAATLAWGTEVQILTRSLEGEWAVDEAIDTPDRLRSYSSSIALADNGRGTAILVVGAPYVNQHAAEDGGPGSGWIFGYSRSIGGAWTLNLDFGTPSRSEYAYFGERLALARVGSSMVLAVGETFATESGLVRTFTLPAGGEWEEETLLGGGGEIDPGFGQSLSLIELNGLAVLAVGTPYDITTNTGFNTRVPLPLFGPDFYSTGSTYLFTRPFGGDWQQEDYIKSSRGDQAEAFGSSVALVPVTTGNEFGQRLGARLFVGAPGYTDELAVGLPIDIRFGQSTAQGAVYGYRVK